MAPKQKTIHVAIGDDAITLRVHGSKHVRTANILGRETDTDGTEHVWLDRIVLGQHEFDALEGGWKGTGAVSTVFYRPQHGAAAA